MYDEKKRKALINAKEAIDALQFYYDLVHTHKISVDNPLEYSRFEYRSMLRNARIATTLDGAWPLPIWKAATDFTSPKPAL